MWRMIHFNHHLDVEQMENDGLYSWNAYNAERQQSDHKL